MFAFLHDFNPNEPNMPKSALLFHNRWGILKKKHNVTTNPSWELGLTTQRRREGHRALKVNGMFMVAARHRGLQWPGGRASDSELSPWFDSHFGHLIESWVQFPLWAPCCFHEPDTLASSPEYWLNPRKWWLPPDMTEKLFSWTLNLNTHKKKRFFELYQYRINTPWHRRADHWTVCTYTMLK